MERVVIITEQAVISEFIWVRVHLTYIVTRITSAEGGRGWVGSDCMNYIFQTLWYELFRRVDTICIIKLILGLKYRSVETLVTKGYLYVLYTFILWFECIEVTYPAFDLRRGRLIREIRWITVMYFAFIW